jgi:hypothetical protein
MSPIRLTDLELAEVRQAAQTVPYDLRQTFLEQLAAALHGKELGPGCVHRTAYEVARDITWTAGRTAVEI